MSRAQKVKVYGHVFSIKTSRDPAFTQEVAHHIDRQMREVAGDNKNSTTEQIALLAALNIAGQLLEERRNNEAVLTKVSQLRRLVEAEISKDSESKS